MPDPTSEGELRRRAFWSGTLTFGLVSIPVALFSAHRPAPVSLRMLGPDGAPLRRRYTCPSDDRPLDWQEIVRGYEVEPDEYVLLTDQELEALEPEKTRDIDLRRFVPVDQIDPIYFERAYFLAPAGQSTRPYQLLAQTMERTGMAGLGTFVMRSKEYIVVILAENGLLRAETLRFPDELRTPEGIGLPQEKEPPPQTQLERMARAVRSSTRKLLDTDVLRDRYAERLHERIRQKLSTGEDVVSTAGEGEEEEEGGVVDLMELLKRSVGASEKEPEPSARGAGSHRSRSRTG